MMVRAGAELLAEADVIVPVPLHRWRLWRRRFNQAMALAERGLARPAACRCDPFLLAPGEAHAPQVGLTQGAARREPAGRLPRAGRSEAAAARASACSSSTTCSPRARPPTPPRGRCCAAAPAPVDVLAFARVVDGTAEPVAERPVTGSLYLAEQETRLMPPGHDLHQGWCPYCTPPRTSSKQKGVAFTEIDITGNPTCAAR